MNIAICDDELLVAEKLKEQIKAAKFECINKTFLFSNGQTLLDEFSDGRIEASIVIMDVKLGRCNGIQLTEQLIKENPSCQIIFMSGFDDYYEDVYDVEHVYFMQKPIKDETLRKAVLRAVEKVHRQNEECFYVNNKSGRFVIPFHEIYTFEKDRRKIIIKTRDGEVCSIYGKFEELGEKLKDDFLRCHNSYIVNLSKVRTMGKDSFVLRDDRIIPISRSYLKVAKQGFIKYIDRESE